MYLIAGLHCGRRHPSACFHLNVRLVFAGEVEFVDTIGRCRYGWIEEAPQAPSFDLPKPTSRPPLNRGVLS